MAFAGHMYRQIWTTQVTFSGPHSVFFPDALKVSLLVLVFLLEASKHGSQPFESFVWEVVYSAVVKNEPVRTR